MGKSKDFAIGDTLDIKVERFSNQDPEYVKGTISDVRIRWSPKATLYYIEDTSGIVAGWWTKRSLLKQLKKKQ